MKTNSQGGFAVHIEEMKPAETAEEMRVEMMRICRHDPMVNNLMRLADYKGFSGEHRYVILAYYALRELAALKKTYYDVVMSRPADPHVLLSSLDADVQGGHEK